VAWTQTLSVPSILEFIGMPETGYTNQLDKIQVRFNMPIDPSTFTEDDITVLPNEQNLSGTIKITSLDEDLFEISGIDSFLSIDSLYYINIDNTSIKSTIGISGLAVQSVSFNYDTSPPLINLLRVNDGGLDEQHYVAVDMNFNESVLTFDEKSISLFKDDMKQSIDTVKIDSINRKSFTIQSFGQVTYPEGSYEFEIDMSKFCDLAGNFGEGSEKTEWLVNRTSSVVISNLSISPDLGHSSDDGVTSGNEFNLLFNLNDSIPYLNIYQDYNICEDCDDIQNYNEKLELLTTLKIVQPGDIEVPLEFITVGNTAVYLEAKDYNGIAISEKLFLTIDETALTVYWNFEEDQTLQKHPNEIEFTFSDRPLHSVEDIQNALILKYEDRTLDMDNLEVDSISVIEYKLKGLPSLNDLSGDYTLGIDLRKLKKYSSGLTGNNISYTNWTIGRVNNSKPVAYAGEDTIITTISTYKLNGSYSNDPDDDILSYVWHSPEEITLGDVTSQYPSFDISEANDKQDLDFLLSVSDGRAFTTDIVTVSIRLDRKVILGCTDPCADNYDPEANEDDGSCEAYDTTCNTDCALGDLEVWNPTDCNCTVEVVTVLGCTDTEACNYNPSANCEDDSCVFEPCNPGCTDPCADNYDPGANEDDGSCETYDMTCNTDCTLGHLEVWNPTDCNCKVVAVTVSGCTDAEACNYNTDANCEDESCVFEPCNLGCTDPCANNYDLAANEDDGSCETYDMTCNTDCTLGDLEVWNSTDCNCTVEGVTVSGCLDTDACNYNPSANCNDGSCIFGSCNFGCTDPCADNYDPEANEDDDSCETYDMTCNTDCKFGNLEIWDDELCECVIMEQTISGCTDQNACNFDPSANCENGSCTHDCNVCHLQDWSALKALYFSTDGDNWKRNDGWEVVTTETPPIDCDLSKLYGIKVNSYLRVAEVNLYNNDLNGMLPSGIGDLSELTALYLSAVNLTGGIPKEIGNLSRLKYLFLVSSSLSGSIPSELGQLTNLIDLRLSYNQLSDLIPSELSKLSNLSYLSLGHNQLSGAIPSLLANLKNLRWLSMSNNKFTGSIPVELSTLSRLRLLTLDHNDLRGCYPTELQNLCDQLIYNFFGEEDDISTGNNFDASWEDFCDEGAGDCTNIRLGDLNNFYLYPNPTTGNVFIEFESFAEQQRNINIYDVSGKIYLTKTLKASGKVELPFPKGIYMVEVSNEFTSKIQKLIIQ